MSDKPSGYDPQSDIKYYDKNGRMNGYLHYIFSITLILLSAFIPVLSLAGDNKILVACLGATITIIGSISALFNFRDKMVSYIIMRDILKRELILFSEGIQPYNTSDARTKLILKMEDLKASNATEWKNFILQSGKTQKQPPQIEHAGDNRKN